MPYIPSDEVIAKMGKGGQDFWLDRKKELAEFAPNEAIRVKNLSNRELFDEHTALAGGDDYDGVLTFKGEITFELLTEEIELRLKDWLAS